MKTGLSRIFSLRKKWDGCIDMNMSGYHSCSGGYHELGFKVKAAFLAGLFMAWNNVLK